MFDWFKSWFGKTLSAPTKVLSVKSKEDFRAVVVSELSDEYLKGLDEFEKRVEAGFAAMREQLNVPKVSVTKECCDESGPAAACKTAETADLPITPRRAGTTVNVVFQPGRSKVKVNHNFRLGKGLVSQTDNSHFVAARVVKADATGIHFSAHVTAGAPEHRKTVDTVIRLTAGMLDFDEPNLSESEQQDAFEPAEWRIRTADGAIVCGDDLIENGQVYRVRHITDVTECGDVC